MKELFVMLDHSLLKLNIENLFAFWSNCGVKDYPLTDNTYLHHSINWPNRLWFDYAPTHPKQNIYELIKQANKSEEPILIPSWYEVGSELDEALTSSGYEIKMSQELMVKSLNTTEPISNNTIPVKQVHNDEMANEWSITASGGFGYPIDGSVVKELVRVKDCYLFLGQPDSVPVVSGILMKTDSVAGIHMVGVPKSHRRKGYAREIMYALLKFAQDLNCEYATLQASTAGETLYQQLGFIKQGKMHTYQKKK